MRNTYYKVSFYAIAIIVIAFNLTTSAHAASAGSLDSSFAVGGKVSTDIFGRDTMGDIAIQADGKIVAVGSNGTLDFVVARYSVNGSLDTSFSSDGVLFTDFIGLDDRARGVAIQLDGKIVVVGYSATTPTNLFAARYNPNGTLDTTFDGDGKVALSNGRAENVLLQPDGKILISGLCGTTIVACVIRLNSNGLLDSTFGTSGVATISLSNQVVTDMVLQSDGKLLTVGRIATGNNDLIVSRFNSNGTLDTTFSSDGMSVINVDNSLEIWSGIAVIFDRILVCGYVGNTASVLRLNSVGGLDSTFGTNGRINFPITGLSAQAIKTYEDQSFIVVGETNGASTGSKTFVAKFNFNGSFDPKFGNNGISIVEQNGTLHHTIELLGNKLIVGTSANFLNPNQQSDFGIHRYNLSNTPTQSGDFDGDGFTDVSVFRPASATWFVLRSSDNTTQIFGFGLNGDIPLDGDFDGDGKNDAAIYRPSVGQWWFQRSSDGTTYATQFGLSTDKPVPDDYDKDGKTDIALFRPSTGEWLILRSSSNFTTFFAFPFGANGDIPISRQGL